MWPSRPRLGRFTPGVAPHWTVRELIGEEGGVVLGKVLTVGITLFWVTMMGLLAHREILPAYYAGREAARAPGYQYLESLAAKRQTRQMGIFLVDRRIGQTLSRIQKAGDEIRITNETRIALNVLDNPVFAAQGKGLVRLSFRFRASVVEGQLMGFRLSVFSQPDPEPLAIVEGVPVGDALKVKIQQGGGVQNLTVPFDPRQILSDLLTAAYPPSMLRVGEKWTIHALDLASYRVQGVTATVVGRERIQTDGGEEDAFVISIPYGAYEAKVWVDSRGEVLRQKVFGFTFAREKYDPDAAEDEAP